MKCANCEHNDGVVYTSIPPKYKCTITNEFHLGGDDCNVEFAPVKRGRWVKDEKESADHVEPIYICSACRNMSAWGETEREIYHYCPNCGAKMSEMTE